jgi:hypothetical protein
MIITDNVIGKVKELNGVNCAPYAKGCQANQGYIDQVFGYCGIPRSRTHDVNGMYGACYFIDVPNIFRDFDADETDENNYDFYYTDEYISAIIKTGAQIVYRLGVTIEWGSKKYTANPPKDFTKWARICERIIMHYNKGWANGFNFGIEYWEIWNEPENPPMWTGTKEQFLELYKISSKYLKAKFPEIKIGGYGSCGFYAHFRPDANDFYKSFLTWFDDFLDMCKKENCPLDFYSWHIYTSNVDEILKSANYVRSKLDEYGFSSTESHLNEWNYGAEGGGFDNIATMQGAGFIASALIRMQDSSIDMAQYYCLNSTSSYNGFWDARTKEYTPVAHVFNAFSKLYNSDGQVEIKYDGFDAPTLSTKKDDKIYALISNYQSFAKSIKLTIENSKEKTAKLYRLTEKYGFVFEREINTKDSWIYLAPGAIYMLYA